ncbi:alpha/beta fold hydrolase [Streptomyces sp. SID13031]|uniref:alpha/beta hydrolase n=1 Tax=Streptomyces sp. SID13031 TaxID=2706046 RepID=UPI0013C8E60A|nr:alpha/beta fold hydrolase [Streptomyces sp. SID13031]NEA35942.1 alpha/beta fold hydrolase [Streptomyces sp. SID13031]
MLLQSFTAILLAVLPSAAAPGVVQTCSDVSTAISVAGVPDGVIYGRYCRSSVASAKPLQILVPGVTYTHAYFDLPGFDGRYSYSKYMNDHGYDTLAIDRLGIGRSTRPALGVAVNAYSNADAVHQVVSAVRAGQLGRSYQRVVLTGHSYGTFVSDLTAATYHDVDGVIGTGWFQQPSALGVVGLVSTLGPAALDPRFFGKILDPTYVTTRPGTRGFFYQADNADPAVIAADDALKDTASLSETTYLVETNTGLSTRIGVPTLRVVGALDRVICNPIACTQAGLEHAAPTLFPAGAEVYVQPGAGHDVALELNNTLGFARSLAWLEERF